MSIRKLHKRLEGGNESVGGYVWGYPRDMREVVKDLVNKAEDVNVSMEAASSSQRLRTYSGYVCPRILMH